MKIFKEFKEFISKGNVVDMAIGLIIGSGFTAIVNSLVKDVLNPVFGFLFGNRDIAKMQLELIPATETTEGVFLRYGSFIDSIVNFLLIAFCIFIVIKQINKLKDILARKQEEEVVEEEKEPELSEEAKLLTEIKELLEKK